MGWTKKLKNLLSSLRTTRIQSATVIESADAPTLAATVNAQQREPIWRRRYTAIQDLDQGGMGRVLLAERKSDALRVCLKFLKPATDRRTGEQECRALLRLRHPGIVALLDFSLEDDPPWLATEYVTGSTLQTYLTKHSAVPVETVLEILKLLLEAVQYAHGEAIIHRDLKPGNLIIDDAEGAIRLRILDFGIAIVDQYDHEGRETAVGADPLGTLLYMAPEQLQGHLLTPACDIYAIGLMAWEMLMGRSVFAGKTRSQMMFEKVTRAAGFELEHETCPSTLAALIEASTRADPASRPDARKALSSLGFRQ
jgi:eukaryotic-like serine/threonine-protein kinase